MRNPYSNEWKKKAPLPEHFEYLEALMVYKEACKRFKRIPAEFEDSFKSNERLKYADEKRQYRTACKIFHQACRKYRAAKARAKHGELTYEKLDEIVGLDVGARMEDIIKEAREQAIAIHTTDEQRDTIANEVLKNLGGYHATRERFMHDSSALKIREDLNKSQERGNINPLADETDSKYDPTLDDFAPLPDSSVKKDDENS